MTADVTRGPSPGLAETSTAARRVRRARCDEPVARGPGAGRGWGRILGAMTKPAALKRHLPTSPFKAPVAPAPKQFAVGDQVTHDVYGLGRVVGVESGVAVLVDFGSAQERILSPYTKMTKL
ncbi:hypothetical protein GCM10018772_31520 [Streptomyces fumanus]|uniref:Uncharacterized protein n=2 Tax=Streptomyces fumanus TaxID=67302 RepID=A0A919AHV2_9ACTN|nr:hypothetical protein GCM10018772_31520 [Streptomyces fumanus]